MQGGSDKHPESAQWDAREHYQDAGVAASYDAARFSSLAGRAFNRLEQRIVVQAFGDVPAGGRIADVPCGTGRLAEPLLQAGYQVHGIDISRQMLDVAMQRLARFGAAFSTQVADARSVDVPVPLFDGVLCARVLMHFALDEQIEFLRGVARLTSGVIVINHSLDSPYQRLRRRTKRLLGHPPSARHPISDETIHGLLSAAGLREKRRYRLNAAISEAVYVVAAGACGG